MGLPHGLGPMPGLAERSSVIHLFSRRAEFEGNTRPRTRTSIRQQRTRASIRQRKRGSALPSSWTPSLTPLRVTDLCQIFESCTDDYCRYQLSMYLVQECVFFVDLLHHGRGAVRMTKSARMSPGVLHLPSKQQPSPSGPYPPSGFSSLLG